MEVSTENSKIMVNSNDVTQNNIRIDGVLLEEVKEFKYLGAVLTQGRQ
jgi:hypothetical protein